MEWRQVTGLVVLQLLKILTSVRTLVYGMEEGDGTGSTTTAENIDHCTTLVYGMEAGDWTGSTTTAENIDHCTYSSVWN